MDGLLLARIQFALTIGYHFLFPSLTMGTAWVLVVLEGIAFFRKDTGVLRFARLLAKIFVITFAIGVGSGIIMSFQFGTNWSRFSVMVNDVIGSFLLPEVVFAFFLESTFMGIYVFGRGRVPKPLHWVSIIMVALGVTMSAFWILSANSWMHTPAGYALSHGKIVLTDFWTAVINHTTIIRFLHTFDSSLVYSAFFLLGMLSWMLLKGKDADVARKLFGGALLFALITSVVQVFPFGHSSIVSVERHQKAKFATLEAVSRSTNELGLILFGVPSPNPPYTLWKIEFPGIMNPLLGTNNTYTITGLDAIPADNRPPLVLTFITFHLMVYLGGLFIAAALLGFILQRLKKLESFPPLLWFFVFGIPLPMVAIEAGWITTEVGRQPWIIQDILRTRDAVTVIAPGEVLFSIILIGALELLFLALYITLVVRTIRKGPEAGNGEAKNG
jgi:cytochrome d ubiquinol oxidase subunit I